MKFTERLYIWLQYLLPHHLMSRLARSVTRSEKPWIKTRLIHWAIRKFGINVSEALDENPDNYASFNAFFTRELKPEARPVDDSPSAIVSPCDGVISQLGRIEHDLIFQAKGQQYSINRLLASEHDRIKRFINGDFINIYLSPKDYHRLHMPVDGTLLSTTYVPRSTVQCGATDHCTHPCTVRQK